MAAVLTICLAGHATNCKHLQDTRTGCNVALVMSIKMLLFSRNVAVVLHIASHPSTTVARNARRGTVPHSLIHSRLRLGSSDWVSHKGDCKILQERGKREKNGEISTGNANQKKLAKMLYQWTEVNTQTVFWSMAHAYHYNEEADPAKVVFDVVVDVETFQITSFRFGFKTDLRYRGFFSESPFSHLQGSDKQWFCVMVNQNVTGPADYLTSMQWRPVTRTDKDWITEDDGAPFPEWPWIAAHLTREDEKRGWAAKMKWNLLITAVHLLRIKFVGSLDKFTAPKLEIGVTFSPPDMDLWYEKINRRLIWDSMVREAM